jgi:hypothetical protein
MTGAPAPAAAALPGATRRPLWLGALVAPCVPAVGLAAASATDALVRGDFIGLHGWPALLGTFVLTLAVGVVSMLAGLPILVWLRVRRRLSGARVCLVALGITALALTILALAGSPLSAFGDLVGLACAVVAAVAFNAVVGVPWRLRQDASGRPHSTHTEPR